MTGRAGHAKPVAIATLPRAPDPRRTRRSDSRVVHVAIYTLDKPITALQSEPGLLSFMSTALTFGFLVGAIRKAYFEVPVEGA